MGCGPSNSASVVEEQSPGDAPLELESEPQIESLSNTPDHFSEPVDPPIVPPTHDVPRLDSPTHANGDLTNGTLDDLDASPITTGINSQVQMSQFLKIEEKHETQDDIEDLFIAESRRYSNEAEETLQNAKNHKSSFKPPLSSLRKTAVVKKTDNLLENQNPISDFNGTETIRNLQEENSDNARTRLNKEIEAQEYDLKDINSYADEHLNSVNSKVDEEKGKLDLIKNKATDAHGKVNEMKDRAIKMKTKFEGVKETVEDKYEDVHKMKTSLF